MYHIDWIHADGKSRRTSCTAADLSRALSEVLADGQVMAVHWITQYVVTEDGTVISTDGDT